MPPADGIQCMPGGSQSQAPHKAFGPLLGSAMRGFQELRIPSRRVWMAS
jgi:hypothetical protein